MTAENPAAPGTVDPNAPAPTSDTATQTPTPTGSEATPQPSETPQPPETAAVPEAYEFQLPEGMELDQAAVDRFTPLFKEAGLTQEAASKLVAAYAEHVSELGGKGAEAFESAYEDRFAADIAKRLEQDALVLKNDPEIGGAKFAAVKFQIDRFIGEHATPEFRELHDRYGLGNNPEIVRMFHRAIHTKPYETGEQPAGAGGGAPDDPRARWYPDLVKK
jgi:hypothetical protein